MPLSALKRSAPSRSPSPRSGGHDRKRARSNYHHVIDLTGDSDDDEINDMLHSIEEEAGELLAGLEGDTKVKIEAPPASRPPAPALKTPVPEVKEEEASNANNPAPVADPASNKNGPREADERELPAVESGELFDLRQATPVSQNPPAAIEVNPAASSSLPVHSPEPAPATAMAVAFPSAPSPAAPPLRSPSPELKAIEVVDLTGDSEDERERSPRSPTPSIDYRVALWAQETRDFVGTLVINPRPDAQFIAERACTSPLWVNNVPQIIIFCDGSSRVTPLMAWEGTNGGYGVVLRNPWAAAAANNQDGNGSVSGFEVRSWSHHKTYSSAEAEMAAIAQSLDTSVGLMGQHRPPTAEVQIFTDSMECWDRITRGLNHRQDRFSFRHTEPILRAIVWLSHRLKIMGGKLTVRWNPRRCAIGPELADDAAGVHSRGVNPEGFNQRNVPLFRRDGILNMLNEQIGAVVRERRTPAPRN